MHHHVDRDRYGPWAVIAGGSDGTGAAFARDLAASGFNLLLVARRQGPLETLAAELRGVDRVEVRTLSLDLDLPDAAQRMVDAAAGLEVGLYVHNAGAESGGHHFLDTPVETMHSLIARNVTTVAEACLLFGKPMRARGRGGIILMGSGTGIGGQPGVAVYSGVKGFVLNLAESLWAELRGQGVDVIGIAAPIMETPSLRRTLGDMVIPGIVTAESVTRNAFDQLGKRPIWVHAYGEPPEESVRQSDVRLQRVLAVEKISASFFGEH